MSIQIRMGTPFLKECDGHFTVFCLFHREPNPGEQTAQKQTVF